MQKKSKKGMYFIIILSIVAYANLFLFQNLDNKVIPFCITLILIPLFKISMFYIATKLRLEHKNQLRKEYYKKQQALVKSKAKVRTRTEYKLVPFPVPDSMFRDHK